MASRLLPINRCIVFALCLKLFSGQMTEKCGTPSPLSPICHDMPYNTSSFPNSLYGHIDATTAEMEITQFQPLMQVECSDVFRQFVCSLYFPDCDADYGDVPPCRDTCEAARSGCEGLMMKFGFQWPQHFNCVNFPYRGTTPCSFFESQKMNLTIQAKGETETTTTKPAGTTTTITARQTTKTAGQTIKTAGQTTTESRVLTTTKSTLNAKLNSTTTKPEVATTTKIPKVATTSVHVTSNQCINATRLAPLCDGMPYNTSSFPNSILGLDAPAATMEASQFVPLLKVQCSDVFKEFMCSLYFPECDPVVGDIPPCRDTCEAAKLGCNTLLAKLGFPWPESMTCDKFPYHGTKRCSYFKSKMNFTTTTTTTATTTTATRVPDVCHVMPERVKLPNSLGHWTLEQSVDSFERFESMLSSACSPELSQYLCRLHFPTHDVTKKPCWEFCLRIRTSCLLQLPVPWPKSFLCETFPSKVTSGTSCWMEESTGSQDQPANVMLGIFQSAFRFLASLLSISSSS